MSPGTGRRDLFCQIMTPLPSAFPDDGGTGTGIVYWGTPISGGLGRERLIVFFELWIEVVDRTIVSALDQALAV